MSHFSVYACTVVEPTEKLLEKMLERFDEEREVLPYKINSKEDVINRGKKRKEDLLERIKKNPDSDYEDEYYQKILNCKTDEDFFESAKEDYNVYDEEGNEYSTYNPDAKWDWYVFGGRWSGSLVLKNGEETSCAQIKDIEFYNEEDKEEAKKFWEFNVSKERIFADEEEKRKYFTLYKPEYFINLYKTKEQYMEHMAFNYPFALLTDKGEWLEQGEMGWFGMSSTTNESKNSFEEYYKKYINDHPNYWLTVIDCHV